MNDLELVASLLNVDEDTAFSVIRLCDELDRRLAIEQLGYAKDTPTPRDLEKQLHDPDYRARLLALARVEGVSQDVVDALSDESD